MQDMYVLTVLTKFQLILEHVLYEPCPRQVINMSQFVWFPECEYLCHLGVLVAVQINLNLRCRLFKIRSQGKKCAFGRGPSAGTFQHLPSSG